MHRNTWISIALFVGLAQLAIPLYMIWNKEQTVQKGTTFLFEIAPIDPTHPLKGKYITLNYKLVSFSNPVKIDHSKATFAVLSKKADQEFIIDSLVNTRPANTTDYVLVYANNWIYNEKNQTDSLNYQIDFPMTEFYMDEYKAPKAEVVYRELNLIDTFQKAHAVISIYKGDAVIQDVIINGKSIVELSK